MNQARKSGTGTTCVEEEEENTCHYMFKFLKWLNPYVVSCQSSSNLVDLASTEEDHAGDSENDNNSSISESRSSPSLFKPKGIHCPADIKNKEVISKVTGNTKYTKHAKTKEHPPEKPQLEVFQ